MSESVKILIEADDKASAKMAAVARNTEVSVKRIKTAGEQTKKSVEFAGSFANALGGTQFGAFAGQLANITEKASQFSEVSKLGGAGALAFKAGLAGLAGVAAFQVGKAFSDMILQTEKWNRVAEEARIKADVLGQKQLALQQLRFGIEKAEAAAREDDEAARAEMIKRTTKELGEQEKAMRKLETTAKVLKFQFMKESADPAQRLVGNAAAFLFSGQQKIAEDEAKRKRAMVDLMTLERTELEQVGVQKQLAVDQLVKSENERLDVMEKQLFFGTRAARVLELQQRDVDKATAERIAKREQALTPLPQIQGLESRLLTRGDQGPQKIVDAIAKLPKSIGEELSKKNHNEPPKRDQIEMKVVE